MFDLETFTLHANTGILLCCSYKEYGHGEIKTIRADRFPNWDKDRANVRPICEAIIEEFYDFDMFVAHNGQWFDKNMLVSWAVKYGLRPFMRFSKFLDPCMVSKRQFRLTSNSLETLAAFLGIKVRKTPIEWDEWCKAAYNGNRQSMDKICHHCVRDVEVLERVHMRMRRLIKDVNERGSAF